MGARQHEIIPEADSGDSMKTIISVTFIFLWGPLLSITLTGCDSKEIYDAKVEKYHKMYCAGAWPLNKTLPEPDCEERRGIDKSKMEY